MLKHIIGIALTSSVVGLGYNLLTVKTPKSTIKTPESIVSVSNGSNSCGGVAITPTKVLTANHCIGINNTVNKQPARIQYQDPDNDFAVLVVDDLKLIPAKLAQQLPDQNTIVRAYGYPKGRLEVTEGTFNHIENNRIVSNLTIKPGYSGGGLYNDQGELIGINISVIDGKNISYAVKLIP